MAAVLYILAKHPQHMEKLRQELAPLIRDSRFDASPDELAHLEHLNAVINETLRLHPPVPTTIYRLTPPEGVMIGSVHVPGGMSVMCPQFALGRSKSSYDPSYSGTSSILPAVYRQLLILPSIGEAVYSKANSFVPERWYQFPDMIKYKDAFAPFSTGQSCF